MRWIRGGVIVPKKPHVERGKTQRGFANLQSKFLAEARGQTSRHHRDHV
jgi:hypothetical protein